MTLLGISDYIEHGQNTKYTAKVITIHLDEGTGELLHFHGYDAPKSCWSDMFETEAEFDADISDKKAKKDAFEVKVREFCKNATGVDCKAVPFVNYLNPADFLCVVWWY